jgi:hypothetical protein
MSSSQLVDGRTGEPIGYNIYSGSERVYDRGGYVATTTSSYVPAAPVSSTYAYGTGSSYAGERRDYAVRGGVEERIVGTTVNTGKEVIKGESRIEYVPFEKKIIEYKDQAKVERIPKKVKRVEYREERKVETIPREVTVTDYYAVEYLRQYIPQYVPEKRIEYVQVPKKQIRYEYIPVERYFFLYSDKLSTTPTRLLRKELKPDTRLNTEPRELTGLREPTEPTRERDTNPATSSREDSPLSTLRPISRSTRLDQEDMFKCLLVKSSATTAATPREPR